MAYERDKTGDEERDLRAEMKLAPCDEPSDLDEGDAESEDSGVSSFLDRFFTPTDKRVR